MTTATEKVIDALSNYTNLRILLCDVITSGVPDLVNITSITDFSQDFTANGVVVGDSLVSILSTDVREITNLGSFTVFFLDIGLPSPSKYYITRGDVRIYNGAAPQDVQSPYIVIESAGYRENTMAHSGGNGVVNKRCRVNMYADSLDECEQLAGQVRLAFAGAGDTDFRTVQKDERDDFIKDTNLYQTVVDYSVWFRL